MTSEDIAAALPHLSGNVRRMRPSGIRAISRLAASVPGALRLEIGQPDIPPPAAVLAAATAAAEQGLVGYAPNAGLGLLREEIAASFLRRGVQVDERQVVVTNGGTQGINLALSALAGPGDEVLVPDPGWPNYAMMAAVIGARAAPYRLCQAQAYQPAESDIARAITGRTRVLILNSPANPLGIVIDPAALTRILGLAADRGLWVISDECYADIVFDSPPATARGIVTDDRLITVHSFSKSYSMAGFRVGYLVAPPALAAVLADVQEAEVSSVNTPAQYAAAVALRDCGGFVRDIVATYRQRKDAVATELRAAGIPFILPAGTFFVWIGIPGPGMPGGPGQPSRGSAAVVAEMLSRARVALAPGPAFGDGGEGYLRMSLVAPADQLAAAARRLAEILGGG